MITTLFRNPQNAFRFAEWLVFSMDEHCKLYKQDGLWCVSY